MSVIEDARELVRTAELPQELKNYGEGGYYWDGQLSSSVGEVTPELLANSLSYQIELKGRPIGDEASVPIGASKYRGLPHLPKDMAWPEGLYFAAQLNLDDLAQVDRSERLPTSGMLYFFFNGAADCQVTHFAGALSELEVREYPDPATLPDAKHYLKQFLKGERIELSPYWLFYLNQGDAYDYRDTRRRLDEDLVESVSAKLGASIATWDKSCRLYGRRHCWQGEDEGMEPIDFDEHGAPIWGQPGEPDLLLFQDEFGEGNIHFMCGFDAAARGDFSGVDLGYSGT